MQDKKINNSIMEISKVIPEKVETVRYDIVLLKKQKEEIIRQTAQHAAQHAAELAEVEDLIARAQAIGITMPVKDAVVDN